MHHEREHVLNISIDKGEGKDTVHDRVRTKCSSDYMMNGRLTSLFFVISDQQLVSLFLLCSTETKGKKFERSCKMGNERGRK